MCLTPVDREREKCTTRQPRIEGKNEFDCGAPGSQMGLIFKKLLNKSKIKNLVREGMVGVGNHEPFTFRPPPSHPPLPIPSISPLC